MSKTVMQSHLEWLKRRCLITPQVESELLEAEKQQLIDAYTTGAFDFDNNICNHSNCNFTAEEYYNLKFKDNDNS